MLRKLYFLLLLAGYTAFAQPITVSTSTYTASELINEVLPPTNCGVVATNVTSSASCGFGYFENNGGSFPFANGIVLRTGNAANTGGPYVQTSFSSTCSGMVDGDLNYINMLHGMMANATHDASFIKFDFQPISNIISFNFIFAGNEYGQFQCNYTDTFAFILTDITTNISTNLGLIPGTNTWVTTQTVRDNAYNGSCTSMNPAYFGTYNVGNPSSPINLAGQTVPMTASAVVDPTHTYRLKLVIADYGDDASDSAVFIEGGSFNLGACQNVLKLSAFIDDNANGIKDNGELPFTHGSFSYQVNNTGDITNNISSYGDVYINSTEITDTYDLSYAIDPEYASYFSETVSYNDISYIENGENIYYFPITNTAPCNDAAIVVVPVFPPRPGFNFVQKIYYFNNGYSTASGNIIYHADPEMGIVSISEAGAVSIPNGFTYDFTNLLPGEIRFITVTLSVPIDPEINAGDLVYSSAEIATTNDFLPANNSNALTQIIVNSYDPNDKMENHGGAIDITDFDADDYLYYTINFQNIGTADAVNIHIDDTLDSMLDEESIRMVAASHNYILERTNNELRWKFDYIYLPGKPESEEGSKGFVTFKIKPKPGYAIGDIIPNTAAIYFDFNPAIVTNTVNTEFTAPLGTPTFEHHIAIYPNPAKNILNVQFTGTSETIQSLTMYDLSGRKVMESHPDAADASLSVSALARGVYMLEIQSAKEKAVRKIVVE